LYKQATQGDYIDVAAPGVDIVSPVPGDQYPSLSGTSMAAAHATGIAALLLELVPSLDAQGIAELLKNNVRDLGMMGRDNRFGAGLLDACRAAAQAIMQSGSDKQLVGCPLEPQQPNQFVSLPGESL
jgi:subtilisin family serine protease